MILLYLLAYYEVGHNHIIENHVKNPIRNYDIFQFSAFTVKDSYRLFLLLGDNKIGLLDTNFVEKMAYLQELLPQ